MFSTEDYYREVANLADTLIQEARDEGLDREAFDERLHETIDGHEYVIYTQKAQNVLVHSSNDGAGPEELGADAFVKDGSLRWESLAYFALRRDVKECLGRRADFDPGVL